MQWSPTWKTQYGALASTTLRASSQSICEALILLGWIEGNKMASGNDKESPFMSPPALSSSLPTAFLLSHLSAPRYKDVIAFQSLSFSPPPPTALPDQTYSVSPWFSAGSAPPPPLLSLVAHSLAHVRCATLGCFFVITFDLEVESGGVRRHTAPLSWGIILWAPSHLNADGNIFQWFNSTPCNIPNKDLFFCLPLPTHTHTHLFPCYAYWVCYKLLYLTNNGNLSGEVQSGEQMQRSLS